jgi:DNA-binding NarL/FixJ family response regulator
VSAPLRVLLADDQRLVRSGFSMILSVQDDIEVVGEASDGRQALEQVRALRPDLVLMDVQMPVMDGIEATRRVVEEGLAKVVILTTFDRDDYLFAGLEAGASGFLLKNADPDQLVEAVRVVGHGHALLAPEVTRRVIAKMYGASPPADSASAAAGRAGMPSADSRGRGNAESPRGALDAARRQGLDLLTEREREVLVLLGRGRSNAEIAADLVLGEATVKTHVSNCLAKLHLRDRIQAVVFAYEAGLILPGE